MSSGRGGTFKKQRVIGTGTGSYVPPPAKEDPKRRLPPDRNVPKLTDGQEGEERDGE